MQPENYPSGQYQFQIDDYAYENNYDEHKNDELAEHNYYHPY
ncbi:MAG: hypothetical protein BWY38_03002 [Ignavibacteria bacterium ADurb.Bin266]|nr:MAG: hypothetical protein BWY38_03002 [Ignavibacteria bacterium ADurb.Bin266]